MPGGRKKNVKKKENKEAPNFVEKFMENRSEAFGILHDAFIRGDLDSELGSESEDMVEVEAIAALEVNQEIMKKMSKYDGKPLVCYEESDQTPLRGRAWKILRTKWCYGMDYAPYKVSPMFLSTAWAKALYSGDYEGVLEIIKGKTENEMKKLLSMRESLLNVCAVIQVVQGAKILHSTTDPDLREEIQICHRNLNVKNEHIKILLKLISLGADVNVRDVAGYTPLHHCGQLYGNDVTLKMAEFLIKAGAEVDAKNRFGQTPLLEGTVNNKLDFISLLLKHGADPSIRDNEDCSPHTTAISNPKIRMMFGKAEKERTKEWRKELKEKTGARLSSCLVCRSSSDTKKCSGCFSVWFCGRDCQLAAWPDHKEKCKEVRAQYSSVHLTPEAAVGENYITGKCYATTISAPGKQHFVVKIQLIHNLERKPVTGLPMVIYDKDRTFTFNLEKKFNEAVHQRLEQMINERGVDGLKGYFHAIVPPSQASEVNRKVDSQGLVKVEINIENILPREAW